MNSVDESRNLVQIQGQTILYQNNKDHLRRTVRSIAEAVQFSRSRGRNVRLCYKWGDASPQPLFSEEEIQTIREDLMEYLDLVYVFFNRNTGTSYGHNRLAQNCDATYLWIMNPDIVAQVDFLEEILHPFEKDLDRKIGIVEGRQTPLEHLKQYNVLTGETSWGSGACTLFRTEAYLGVNGYDEKSFFMYCDDVDISWRIRLKGYRVIYQPTAVVFHDKRLSEKGQYIATDAEVKFTLEARLLMAWKWSYPRLVEKLLDEYGKEEHPAYRFALESFWKRQRENRLPKPIDPEHKAGDIQLTSEGTFLDYGASRY